MAWNKIELGKITKNLDNKRIPLNSEQRAAKNKKGLYPYIGANNILCYIDEYIFDEKILCIAEDGGSWGATENCAFIYNEKCWVNNHTHVLRENGKSNLEYLRFYLNYTNLNSYVTGTTRGKLTRKALEQIKIPLPPLDDQIRIAIILSCAETIITKRKESISLLDDLMKSVFMKMFGPSAIGYENWPFLELQQLAENKKGSMRTGPFGSNLLHNEFKNEGDVAVLGIDNAVNNKFEWKERRYISQEKYNELKNYRIYPRDVIITIMGTTGRSAVIPEDIPLAINTKHLAAITLDKTKANPHFISFAIHSSPFVKNQLLRKNRGAIMDGLNLGLIKEIELKIPPVEHQDNFEKLIHKVEAIKEKYELSLREYEKLYTVLCQRAFRGELDLSRIPVEDDIKPDPTKQKSEGHVPEVLTTKQFTSNELIGITGSKEGRQIISGELRGGLEQASFEEPQKHDEARDLVFNMMG